METIHLSSLSVGELWTAYPHFSSSFRLLTSILMGLCFSFKKIVSHYFLVQKEELGGKVSCLAVLLDFLAPS